MHPAGPGANVAAIAATAATAGPNTSSPPGTAPATAATAERDHQEGLSQVHARLQTLLQHLPEAAEAGAQGVASLESGPEESTPDLAPAAVEQTHQQTQSNVSNDTQADQAKHQDMDEADDAPSPAVATTPDSSLKAMQPSEVAADEAATAVQDAATAEAHEAGVSSTIPVVCGCVQGIYDANRGMVVIKEGKASRPNKVEIMAGKGDGKTWAETIQVDLSNGKTGVSLGKWLKSHRSEARAKSRTSPQGKQRILPAQRAKRGLSSAVVMADGTVQLDDQGCSKAQNLGPHATASVLKHVRASFSPSCICWWACLT